MFETQKFCQSKEKGEHQGKEEEKYEESVKK